VPLGQVHDDRAVDDQHNGGHQEPGQVPAPEHRPDQPDAEQHAHRRGGNRDEGQRMGERIVKVTGGRALRMAMSIA
jgi:hypothetical protein